MIDNNSIIIGLNNFTLRKRNVKPRGYDRNYLDTDVMKDKLYQLVAWFNERKIYHKDFYSALLLKQFGIFELEIIETLWII